MKKLIPILAAVLLMIFCFSFSVTAAERDLPSENDKYPDEINELLPGDFKGKSAAEISKGITTGNLLNASIMVLRAVLPKTIKSVSTFMQRCS